MLKSNWTRARRSNDLATGGGAGVPSALQYGLRWPLVAGLSLMLGACGLTGSGADFSAWTIAYNQSVEKAQSQNLLLNVVRAGESMPLYFTAVQVVRGQGQNAATASLGFSLSRTLTSQSGTSSVHSLTSAAQPGLSLQVLNGFNFDVAILDTSEFYQGLLTPVSIGTIQNYLAESIPPELLYHLLIERITISQDGRSETYINDPSREDYGDYLVTISNLLDLGLTAEAVSQQVPVGPVYGASDLKDIKSLVAGAQAGLILTPVEGGFQIIQPVTTARFCFMGGDASAPKLPQSALCATSPKLTGADANRPRSVPRAGEAVAFSLEGASMQVQTRSSRDVFNYLGLLAYLQTHGSPERVPLLERPESRSFNHLNKGRSLFKVVRDRPESDDLVAVDFRGVTYSIPDAEQGYSATVISLVTQLLSLSKSVNALPSTGTVVVR